MRFALAFLMMFGVAGVQSSVAQALSVGERLAADLTWTQAERDVRFRRMETLFPVHRIRRGRRLRALPAGPVLLPPGDVQGFLQNEHMAGVLVLVDGRVRNEAYGLGLTRAGHWTSFSVSKAVTDTLAGVAIRNGSVHSLTDPVTAYLPEMRGSAYEGVTVRQLMTMTSGVRWNENYTTADADNVRLYTTPVASGLNSTIEYMRRLPREAAPGTRWKYNTGETDLLGVLLQRAAGRSLSEQLRTAVWAKAGMERDATWITSSEGPAGQEFGGSGLSATLRDFGRLGLWVLRGGDGAVAPRWFAEAGSSQVKAGGAAYGYGWWPQKDGSFAALGIFGQSILVDPSRHLVVVMLGDWDAAGGAAHSRARVSFWESVKGAVDNESLNAKGAKEVRQGR